MHEDDPFQPATLVMACEGCARASSCSTRPARSSSRVNCFLGFNAIGRIQIVQKPVPPAEPQPKPRREPLTAGEAARLAAVVGGIEDEGLRASLERLGTAVLAKKRVSKIFRVVIAVMVWRWLGDAVP